MKKSVAVLFPLVLLAGCGSDSPDTEAARTVARLDAHRTLGEPVLAGNLTVWPVYSDQPQAMRFSVA